MSNFIDDWATHILENRADKSWEPLFFCSKDLGDHVQTVAGYNVVVDEALPPNTLDMRDQNGAKMATYTGIHAPEPAKAVP